MKTVALLASSLVVLCACAPTMSKVISSKAKGTAVTYPVSSDQAWKIARQVFRWDGTDTIEEHRDENMMLTTVSSSPGYYADYGSAKENVGAWVEEVGANSTKVTVVTKGMGALTEDSFHLRFNQAVGILESGRPLPVEAPRMPEPPPVKCSKDADCNTGSCIEGLCRR